MANSVLGIELGNTNIKIIETKKKGKGLFLKNAIVIETPPGTVLDGAILDVEKVGNEIKKVIESKKIKAEEAIVLVASSQIVTRDIMLKVEGKKQVSQLLKFGINEYFPMPLDEYQVNFHITGSFQDEEGKKQNVTLMATPNKIVEDTLYLLSKLKLKPIAMTMYSDAMAKAFRKSTGIVGNEEDEVLVVDIGGTTTRFTTISSTGITSTKEISFGSETMSELIRRQFNGNEPVEVETFKRKYGYIYIDGEEDESNHYGVYISNILKSSLEYELASEMTRFIRLYESRTAGKQPISKIYLIGGGSKLNNLERYIEHTTGLQTLIVNFLEAVTTSNVEDLSEYPIYTIGLLAACTNQCVNLLPEGYFKRKQNKRYIVLLSVLAVSEILLAGTRAYKPIKGVIENNNKIIALEAQIVDPKFDDVRALQKALEEKTKEYKALETFFSQIPKDDFITGRLIDNIIDNVPLGVSFNEISFDKETGSITLNGNYQHAPNVLGYFSKLQSLYKEADVTFTLGEKSGDAIYADFTVTIQFLVGTPTEEEPVENKEVGSETTGGEDK